MKRSHHRFTRRRLLQGGAASALGLPFLGAFARADEASARRVIIVFSPNDSLDRPYWGLGAPGSDVALPDALPSFLAPLDPFRSRVELIGDLDDVFGTGHASIGEMLSGVAWVGPDSNNFWADGITVDQHIAQALGVEALTLGVQCGINNGNGRFSYLGPAQPVDPIEDPVVAFDWLFADLQATPDELAAKRARRHSILDRAAGDLERYRAAVPASQRPKLDAHLDAVRTLEAAIDNDLANGCDPDAPVGIADAFDNAAFPEVTRRQMDIAVQALACGATRVATLQLSRAGGQPITPLWANEGIELNLDCHTIAHDFCQSIGGPNTAQTEARRVAMETWFVTQLGYLLAKLDAVPDGDGTLLDSTVVVWMKELSHNHSGEQMLYILAGDPQVVHGGRFRSFPGRPHNDLLLSLCGFMGLPDESFGDPLVTTGALPS